MGIISWIVLGLIVGALAKFLMPGKDPGDFIVTTIIGILGAVVGGFISTRIGLGSFTGFNLASIVIAVGGAMILLILYKIVRGKRI
jgi:uncharacterized membrane protein YeaQ/YmgE (transglycosylase-associated protein family)